MEDGDAPVDLTHNPLADCVGLAADNQHRLLVVKAQHKEVGGLKGQEEDDGGIEHRFQAEEKYGHGHQEQAVDKVGGADADVVVFLGHKAQNVDASGGGFCPVHQGAAQTFHNAAGKTGEKGIVHIDQGLEERGAVQNHGENQAAYQTVKAEELPHVTVGQEKQGDIHKKAGGTGGPLEQIVQNHGKPSQASGEKMVLEKETVDTGGHEHTAKGGHAVLVE